LIKKRSFDENDFIPYNSDDKDQSSNKLYSFSILRIINHLDFQLEHNQDLNPILDKIGLIKRIHPEKIVFTNKYQQQNEYNDDASSAPVSYIPKNIITS
jgi:hypothetical protein